MRKLTIERRISGNLGNIILPFVTISIVSTISPTFANDVTISGGISVSYEKYDRQYENDAELITIQKNSGGETAVVADARVAEDDTADRFRFAPFIELAANSARDDLSLRYSPSFRYDIETYDNDVDHDLNASAKRMLTKDWRLLLSENYRLSDRVEDQYDTVTDNEVQLSDNERRRKYWTNSVKIVSEYTYLEGGLFSLGYNYGILENVDMADDDSYNNYDRHELQFSIHHRYNPIWKIIVAGGYVRGLFDDVGADERGTSGLQADNDLKEYRASTKLESNFIEYHPLSLGYSYYAVDYDADERNNGAIHDLTLGWQWLIDKDWTYSLGGGPSYVEKEGEDDTWGYNANTSLQYGFEKGSLALSATRGFSRQNFSGTEENGLSEFWQTRIDFTYQLREDLAWRLYTAYHYDEQDVVSHRLLEPTDSEESVDVNRYTTETDTFNRKRFSAGTGIGYTFWQWYSLALSYDYAVQDSEKVNDSYDEHRIFLTLSVQIDLLNW